MSLKQKTDDEIKELIFRGHQLITPIDKFDSVSHIVVVNSKGDEDDDFFFFRRQKTMPSGKVGTVNINPINMDDSLLSIFLNGEPQSSSANAIELRSLDSEEYETLYQESFEILKLMIGNNKADLPILIRWPDGSIAKLYFIFKASFSDNDQYCLLLSDKPHNGKMLSKIFKVVGTDYFAFSNEKSIQQKLFDVFNGLLKGNNPYNLDIPPVVERIKKVLSPNNNETQKHEQPSPQHASATASQEKKEVCQICHKDYPSSQTMQFSNKPICSSCIDKYFGSAEIIKEYENKNYSRLYSLLLKAATAGYAGANNLLGILYYYELGVEQDYEKANSYYYEAYKGDYPSGPYNIGRAYYNGEGVEKDYDKSLQWFLEADALHHYLAANWIGWFYQHKGEMENAVKYYKKGANQNDPDAIYNLALMYLDGQGGLLEDSHRALSLFYDAAALGQLNANFRVAAYYLSYKDEKTQQKAAKYVKYCLENDMPEMKEYLKNNFKIDQITIDGKVYYL